MVTSVCAWGHVNPMVPLAAAFRARGDDVLWVTAPSACERLARAGFRTATSGLDEKDALPGIGQKLAAFADKPPRERPDFGFAAIFGELFAPPMLAGLLPIAADWQPQLVISDAGEMAGPIVA